MLPKIENPNFTIKVSEFKKPLTIRPMVVSEHKAIYQANDIYGEESLSETIGRIVASCTNDTINMEKTPQYLLEYIFIRIYIASVDGIMSSVYKCKSTLKNDDGSLKLDEETGDVIHCTQETPIQIPLDEIKIMYPDDYEKSKTIKVIDGINIKLKGLSLSNNNEIQKLKSELYTIGSNLNELAEDQKDEIKALSDEYSKLRDKIRSKFIYHSIEAIHNKDEVIETKNLTEEELCEWFDEQCPSKVNADFEEFLEKSPMIGLDINAVCPKCLTKKKIELRGLNSFL